MPRRGKMIQQGLSSSALWTFGPHHSLWGDHPVHCTMSGGIPGLPPPRPPDASSTTTPSDPDNQKCPQMLPHVTEGTKSPSVENHFLPLTLELARCSFCPENRPPPYISRQGTWCKQPSSGTPANHTLRTWIPLPALWGVRWDGLPAARGLSLVVVSGGGGTLRCGARASHCGGFSCCGARALGAQASVVVARGL